MSEQVITDHSPCDIAAIFSVAPMLDITDRHCRYFFRLFSPNIRLYTEMIHAGAIVHGDTARFLQFDAREHPLALQLGGSDPAMLAVAAKHAEDWGYDEINLNVGCPSPRVQSGRFGACLMAEPELVAECVATMKAAVSVPVTVKHRIGIDDQDDEAALHRFVQIVSQAGCEYFIVHARKAWLQGLSPKENRDVPPLDYDRVYRLAREFPTLQFTLNGGLNDLAEAKAQLAHVEGVMLGRAVCDQPWLLNLVESIFYGGSAPFQRRRETVEAYADYLHREQANGVWLKHMVRPMMGLFHGEPHAKLWRRRLAESMLGAEAKVDTLFETLNDMGV